MFKAQSGSKLAAWTLAYIINLAVTLNLMVGLSLIVLIKLLLKMCCPMKKKRFLLLELNIALYKLANFIKKNLTNYNYIIINTNCGFLKNCLFLQGTKMLWPGSTWIEWRTAVLSVTWAIPTLRLMWCVSLNLPSHSSLTVKNILCYLQVGSICPCCSVLYWWM